MKFHSFQDQLYVNSKDGIFKLYTDHWEQYIQVDATISGMSQDKDGDLLIACAGIDKVLRIFKNNTLVKQVSVPKRLSCIKYNSNGQWLLADRSGDFYSFNEELVLLGGHVSMITDILQADDYLLTADNDEKVRVSQFPGCYDIHGFLLGHTQYIRSMVMVGEHVLTAAGDGNLLAWSYKDLQLLASYDISQDVLKIAANGNTVYIAFANSDEILQVTYSDQMFTNPKKIQADGVVLDVVIHKDNLQVLTINGTNGVALPFKVDPEELFELKVVRKSSAQTKRQKLNHDNV